jgi:hypothetical protein
MLDDTIYILCGLCDSVAARHAEAAPQISDQTHRRYRDAKEGWHTSQ